MSWLAETFDSILKSLGHREGWRTAGTFLGRSMCFVYRDTDRRNPNRDGTEAIPQITNWTGRGRLPLPPREGRAPSRPIFSSLLN